MKKFPQRPAPAKLVANVDTIDSTCFAGIIERIDDGVVARLVVEHIQASNLQDRFPGVWLAALETIKRSQIAYASGKARSEARYARAKVAGAYARQASIGIVKISVMLVKALTRGGLALVRHGLIARRQRLATPDVELIGTWKAVHRLQEEERGIYQAAQVAKTHVA